MAIEYYLSLVPEETQLVDLYSSVGWVAYVQDPDALLAGVQGSAAVATAWDGDTLVGLARVISDGHTIAYLQDIVVRPSHQRRGIATTLMATVFEPFSGVRQHVLLTDARSDQRQFYESVGFKEIRDFGGEGLRSFVRFQP